MQAVVAVMTIGIFGTLFLQNVDQVHWLVTLPLAASISFFNTINWHRYLNIQYGSSSSSTTRGGYSGYGSGLSTGGGSSSDSGGSSFGGGSSDGGGAGGSW